MNRGAHVEAQTCKSQAVVVHLGEHLVGERHTQPRFMNMAEMVDRHVSILGGHLPES